MYDIEGVKFHSTELTFDNGAQVEVNRCYCTDNPCHQKFGVRNLTALLHRPFYVSHPHFYAADSSYSKSIEGMNPDAKKHQSRIILEKVSSVDPHSIPNFQIIRTNILNMMGNFKIIFKILEIFLKSYQYVFSHDISKILTIMF